MSCGETSIGEHRDSDPARDAGSGSTVDAGSGSTEWCTGAVSLSTGSQGDTVCVVKADGSLWCWGGNGCGTLGPAVTDFSTVPVASSPNDTFSGGQSVSVGWSTTCAVESTGVTKCWGGVLPWSESTSPCSTVTAPTTVPGLPSTISAVATGNDHACAITTEGSAWCWGNNRSGQLGDGTLSDRSTAAPVSGLTSGVASISTGHSESCAVKTDGSLWCWGLNYAGQVGDGTATMRAAPVQVFGMASGVAGVSVGNSYACAVKTDGSVWCWGNNNGGVYGDGTTESSLVPVRAKLTPQAKAVTAGDRHVCAVATDGTVWCWGDNVYGVLGYATPCDAGLCAKPSPARVSGLPANIVAATAGYIWTCALDSHGTVWCWGSDDSGQLGDGKRTPRSTPKRVLPCGG